MLSLGLKCTKLIFKSLSKVIQKQIISLQFWKKIKNLLSSVSSPLFLTENLLFFGSRNSLSTSELQSRSQKINVAFEEEFEERINDSTIKFTGDRDKCKGIVGFFCRRRIKVKVRKTKAGILRQHFVRSRTGFEIYKFCRCNFSERNYQCKSF